jgi:hypothetical protein
MPHLSEEERGRIEQQLLEALEEALIQFQEAPISERQAARTKYLQAIKDFTQFVAQYLTPADEVIARETRLQVA